VDRWPGCVGWFTKDKGSIRLWGRGSEHPLSQSLIPRPKTVHEQPDEPINDALDTLEDDINEINHRQISVIVTSQSVISSDPEYWTL